MKYIYLSPFLVEYNLLQISTIDALIYILRVNKNMITKQTTNDLNVLMFSLVTSFTFIVIHCIVSVIAIEHFLDHTLSSKLILFSLIVLKKFDGMKQSVTVYMCRERFSFLL